MRPSAPDCFFYGVLMDRDVLAAVIGRTVPGACVRPARLYGYRRVRVEGAVYPALVAKAGERVEGVLVRGIAAPEFERLRAFEGEAYVVAETWVTAIPGGRTRARLFMPRVPPRASTRAWSPEQWRRRHRASFLRGIRAGGV